jgi:hypothetical protein
MNQQKAWQAKLDGYGKAKAELRVKDFEDAEAVAQELFNVTQQGVMLQGADNPALVVYALGKNPKKARAGRNQRPRKVCLCGSETGERIESYQPQGSPATRENRVRNWPSIWGGGLNPRTAARRSCPYWQHDQGHPVQGAEACSIQNDFLRKYHVQ